MTANHGDLIEISRRSQARNNGMNVVGQETDKGALGDPGNTNLGGECLYLKSLVAKEERKQVQSVVSIEADSIYSNQSTLD